MNRQKLIHAVAWCEECDWEDGWYLTAQKSGRHHNLKTGHKVVIETGYSLTYNHKDTTDEEAGDE